ncbi:MAG TPA: Nif3-like dinuclear metal center hexameric protein [Micromonosporaceae bacterium]
MTTDAGATPATVADVVRELERRYPPRTAQSWDRVGLVVGEPAATVRRVLFVVDCVPETVAEAVEREVDLMVAHHPLLLRGVHSVATTDYKGAVVHQLIRAGIALYVAHTNADSASPGVTDALAARLDLADVRQLVADDAHPGRIGRLPHPMTVAQLAAYVADRLPATAAGVRAAGEPDRVVSTLALSGGAGDDFLRDAAGAGVDAYLTADLRHHPASEHLAGGGPVLIDAAHWATERPWLDLVAGQLSAVLPIEPVVSDLVTDVWTVQVPSPKKESRS